MSEQKLSGAWQCQSCGCYFPHIPKVLDGDVKRCSKCVEVEILEAKLEAMKRVRLAAEALSADVHEAFPEGLIDMPDYAQLIYELDAALAAARKE